MHWLVILPVAAAGMLLFFWLRTQRRTRHAETPPQAALAAAPDAEASASAGIGAAFPDGARRPRFIPAIREATFQPGMQPAQSKGRSDALNSLISQFPPLAPTVTQLLSEIGAIDCSAERVSQLVLQDPMLALEVLRISNSAMAAQEQPVTSLKHAVLLIGYDAILAIALRGTMSTMLGRAPVHGFSHEALLRHNMAAGLIGGAIAGRMQRACHAEATTITLLHDIGKIVFNSTNAALVADLFNPATTILGESRLAKEERLFGSTHAIAGALLAARWSLPEQMVEIIKLHHHPLAETFAPSQREKELTAILFIANQLAKYANCPGDDLEIDLASDELFKTVGLPCSFEESYALVYPEVERTLNSIAPPEAMPSTAGQGSEGEASVRQS